jgi:AcrR family transcriptional regulator
VTEEPRRKRRLSQRGQRTRDELVEAADQLMRVRGVNATTLDDVRRASGKSKSQLYAYFPDKAALVREVARHRAEFILRREHGRLETLKSFAGLVRWRDALIEANSLHNGAYGCALGSMTLELSDQDEETRETLSATFAAWEKLISDGLRRMQEAGVLSGAADPDRLATGLMAALQGGYLLANAAHDVEPMAVALDMGLDHIKSFLVA